MSSRGSFAKGPFLRQAEFRLPTQLPAKTRSTRPWSRPRILNHRVSPGAFSLLEVAISALVLSIVFIPVLDVLQFSVKGTRQSLHLSRAFQAARSMTDLIQSFRFEDLDDEALAELAVQVPAPEGANRARFDKVESIRLPLANGQRLDSKLVTVRVSWERAEGIERKGEVVLKAVVCRAR